MKHYKKAFTLSFDDGISQDIRLVQLINRYGLKAAFNLNTGIQSEESRFLIEGKEIYRMEQQGLKSLYEGHEIASHGFTHADLTKLGEKEMRQEILRDMDAIETLYGVRPVGFAYPYGTYDDRAISCLRSLGIRYARTVVSSHCFDLPKDSLKMAATCHFRDEKLMELAKEFVEMEPCKPSLFYVWGHSYELDVYDTWQEIEEFFAYISGRDDIYYGTNAQCLKMAECEIGM